MIIVEGCDNSGKTTLINQLAKPTGFPVVQAMGKPYNRFTTINWIQSSLQMGWLKGLFFDRHALICEQVYGPVIRKGSILAPRDLNKYLHALLAINPLIIYCRPSLDVITNWGDRDQMDGVKDNVEAIVQAYDDTIDALCKMGFMVRNYDWTHQYALNNLEPILHAWIYGSVSAPTLTKIPGTTTGRMRS